MIVVMLVGFGKGSVMEGNWRLAVGLTDFGGFLGMEGMVL